MKRILIYNWTPLHIDQHGGGVAVYVRNLINYLLTHKELDIEPTFISSGYYYDGSNRSTYIRREKTCSGIEAYSIVNSPIMAPSLYAVSSLYNSIFDKKIQQLVKTFISLHGPYDAVFFESFEGVSSNILQLKKWFPHTKFYHFIHDYGIICPNVKLWNYKEENCLLNNNKFDCSCCLKEPNSVPLLEHISYCAQQRNYTFDATSKDAKIIRIVRAVHRRINKFIPYVERHKYATYRTLNIKNINQYSDGEICVSKRVAQIIEACGVNKDIIHVEYIGTAVAENAKYVNLNPTNSQLFTILYMGYASKEKGFYHYLYSLEQIPNSIAANIQLKFAAKLSDEVRSQIMNLKRKGFSVIVYDGYKHEDMPSIFESVNLGIVPPLWEDNLPQVAIEMVANGIPVLTNMNGGAHELNNHPDFVYDDLGERIIQIYSHRELLTEYWNYSLKLTTMQKHVMNLLCLCKNS